MHQARHDADSYQRVELITGRRRRRDWSDEEKARILAESADPGGERIRSGAAQRGQPGIAQCVAAQGAACVERMGRSSCSSGSTTPSSARPDATDPPCVLACPAERIEVTIAGATVRVPVGVDAATLERVLAAVRSTR